MSTASELLASQQPAVAEAVAGLSEQLAGVQRLTSIFESHDASRQRVGAERVLGVSAVLHDKQVTPAVILALQAPVIRVLSPHQAERSESDAIDRALHAARSDLAERIGGQAETVAMIGLPAPIELVAPGDEANCGNGKASFGSRVTTANAGRGILTAGHAAPTVNAGAYDNAAKLLGTVTASCSCAAVGRGVVTADIAAIDLDPHIPDTASTVPAATLPSAASIWDDVTAYGAITSGQQSALLTVGTSFAGPSPSVGIFGEAMLTAYAISAPGDSGAPVYNQNGELIGHIVAGYPGVYSVVQDVSYQLKAIGASLR